MSKTKEITFDEALEIAKEHMSQFNTCNEYTNAYSFSYDWGEIRYGGIGSPCMIMKADGKAVDMPIYIMRYGGGEIVRSIPVETYIRGDD